MRRLMTSFGVALALTTTAPGRAGEPDRAEGCYPVTWIVFNDCIGEQVRVDATICYAQQKFVDGDGGYHMREVLTITGTGTGQRTGTRYVLDEVLSYHLHESDFDYDPISGVYISTVTDHIRLLPAAGRGKPCVVNVVGHVTMVDGEVKTYVNPDDR